MTRPLTPTEAAQRWVLALPWHAVLRWGARWDRFGLLPAPERSHDAAELLQRRWGLTTSADIERTLAALSASAQARDAAWHLTNLVLVAELAVLARLIDPARAWAFSVEAARALQRLHRGWFSMAEGYLRGLGGHRDDVARPLDPLRESRVPLFDLVADPDPRALLTTLHAAPDSPWNTLAWNTPLPEVLPLPGPCDDLEVLDLTPDDDLDYAVSNAAPNARIRLAPGLYPAALVLADVSLERAEHAPAGSVILEFASDDRPVIAVAPGRGAILRGLTLRGAPHAAAVALAHGYLRLEECRVEGARVGVEALADPPSRALVQLDGVVFEGQGESAIELAHVALRARDVAVAGVGGCGLSAAHADVQAEDLLVEAPDRAGVLMEGGRLVLRKARIHDAQFWGIQLCQRASAELVDVEILRALIGLHALDGATVTADRCRIAQSATANIELLDIGGAHFRDCHVTGGDFAGVWLHPGHGARFFGGQIGGSRHACLMVEGGRGVVLDGVGLGPSLEGGGLFAHGEAELVAERVFVSGAVTAGVELRGATLAALDLRVRGSAEGVLLRDGAHLEVRRLDLADIPGTGLWLCGSARDSATVEGLGLRKVGFGVVVGAGSAALVRDLVASHTPIVADVVSGRLALAGQTTLSGGILRARHGFLAARNLIRPGLSATGAELHLEGGRLGSLELHQKNRLVLLMVEGTPEPHPELELVRDPPPPPITAMSPLLLVGQREAFEAWHVTPSAELVLRLARALSRRLGIGDKLAFREAQTHVRVDGPLPFIARFAPAFEALFEEVGALGLLLAEVALAPVADATPRALA